jgi:hypothetical protein
MTLLWAKVRVKRNVDIGGRHYSHCISCDCTFNHLQSDSCCCMLTTTVCCALQQAFERKLSQLAGGSVVASARGATAAPPGCYSVSRSFVNSSDDSDSDDDSDDFFQQSGISGSMVTPDELFGKDEPYASIREICMLSRRHNCQAVNNSTRVQ